MATQTRTQGSTRAKQSRSGSKRTNKPTGLSLWAIRAREFAQGIAPDVSVSDRFKREVLGVTLVILALLSAWSLGRGAEDGAIIAWWGKVQRDLLGNGAFLVPVFAVLTSVRTLTLSEGPILLFRHYFGGAMFLISVTSMLSFGNVGGYVGDAFGDLGVRFLGLVVSGIVFFAIGWFSVFLLADTDLQTLERDIRRLLPGDVPPISTLIPDKLRNIGKKKHAPDTPVPGNREDHFARAMQSTVTQTPSRVPSTRWRSSVATQPQVEPTVAGPTQTESLAGLVPTPSERPDLKAKAERNAKLVGRRTSTGKQDPEDETTPDVIDAEIIESTSSAQPAKSKPVAPQAGVVINIPDRPREGQVKEIKPVSTGAPPPPADGHIQAGLKFPLPDLRLLPYYEQVTPEPRVLEEKAEVIEDTLKSFKVNASVREINPGPAVTQFALEPGNGVKVRRITELQNDLALALAAPSIRVEAPIPGMARVGIEIPNAKIATVGLREVLESPAFTKSKAKLPMPLGRDVNGRYIVGDLTRMPHLLIAGATGSGKSVCINGIISTLISVKQPDELRLLMIDPKMVELVGYNGVPHLQCPVVTEMDKVVSALRMVLREMNRRYELFKSIGVRNIDGYRTHTADDPDAEKMPYLVVIIDELADLMMTTPDEVETLLARLTQMARATGIHLIIATQRPSVNVLTGLIKANVPARIAFAVSSMTDSRVVLDMPGAERLLGRGDMLYLPPDEAKPTRVQGAFIDEEVTGIVGHWTSVAEPQYAPEWLDLPSSNKESAAASSGGGWDEEEEPYMQQALDIVRAQGTASASMLQRRLRIGYNRAARIIEQMEEDGIIGPADGSKGRPVLVSFSDSDLDDE